VYSISQRIVQPSLRRLSYRPNSYMRCIAAPAKTDYRLVLFSVGGNDGMTRALSSFMLNAADHK